MYRSNGMKKEVQGRWGRVYSDPRPRYEERGTGPLGRVATRCAASAWYVEVSRRGVNITKIMIATGL